MIGPIVKVKIAHVLPFSTNALRRVVEPPGKVNTKLLSVVVNGIPPIVPLTTPPVAVISPVVGWMDTPSKEIPVITIGMIDGKIRLLTQRCSISKKVVEGMELDLVILGERVGYSLH